MNVLLLAPRCPWPPFTGDRLRATIWLSALDNVALVAPPGEVPSHVRFYPAKPSARAAMTGALRVLGGAPVQSLLAARYDWTGAIDHARRDFGSFDATIVILSRLDPVVRHLLPDGFHVLDAIDSLHRSAQERARESTPLLRWFWTLEARRMARVEDDAARAYDRVLFVSEEDGPLAITNGVAIEPLGDAPRAYDFGFWGRLAYFANADAAHWLLDELWPAIRARRPHATLFLGGADAPANLRAFDGRDGITVQSPIPDVPRLARGIRVALFPVRYGTGQSSKALEAAEAGCAIVATRKAMRGLDALLPFAKFGDDTRTLADLAVAALDDRAAGLALRHAVETNYARSVTLARLAAVLQRAEAAA